MNIKIAFDTLDAVERTPGTNDKLALLSTQKDNSSLVNLLQLGLDDRITFGVSKIKDIPFTEADALAHSGTTLTAFQELCFSLYHRKLTGHAAHRAINWCLSLCDERELKWFKKIIEKDLSSLRLGASLVNRVWPLLCLDYKCMLAEKEEKIEKVDFSKGAGAELKGNGIRTIWHFGTDGKMIPTKWYPSYSGPVGRSGMPLPQFAFLGEYMEQMGYYNMVVDTEVHVNHILEDVQTLSQYEEKDIRDFTNAKGVVSKSWQKEVEKAAKVAEIRSRASVNVIDILTSEEWEAESCSREYSERRFALNVLVNKRAEERGLTLRIASMPYVIVNRYEEAIEAAKAWIDQGLEGAIIKPMNGYYRWTRHTDWVKIKEEVEEDVLIIGYEVAEQTYDTHGNPNPPILGVFIVVDSEGRKFGVGTGKGWTYEFYKEALENIEDYMNRVMKITAQRFTSKAAICPRFSEWRPDKTARDIIS